MELAGKRVLITGGGQRLGAMLAQRLAEAGAKVYLHARTRRDEEAFPTFYADFALPGAAAELCRALPELDILINNASSYAMDRLATGAEGPMREQFEVNFWAPLTLMRHVAAQGNVPSVILNILDQEIAGTTCVSGSYGLSRRLLAEATRSMALELAPRTRVCGVAPGPVLAPPGKEHLGMAKTLAGVPLARPVGVEDFLAGVLFLLRNNSITGEILFIDGGQHIKRD